MIAQGSPGEAEGVYFHVTDYYTGKAIEGAVVTLKNPNYSIPSVHAIFRYRHFPARLAVKMDQQICILYVVGGIYTSMNVDYIELLGVICLADCGGLLIVTFQPLCAAQE